MPVDAQSNEITAIPRLLEMLELSGCWATIDAPGCQTEIAQAIVDAGAGCMLAVKGNQRTLHEGMRKFDERLEDDFARVNARHDRQGEKRHGRVVERYYFLHLTELEWLAAGVVSTLAEEQSMSERKNRRSFFGGPEGGGGAATREREKALSDPVAGLHVQPCQVHL